MMRVGLVMAGQTAQIRHMAVTLAAMKMMVVTAVLSAEKIK